MGDRVTTTAVRTTTLYDVIDAVDDILAAATFPTHPNTGRDPTIWDGTGDEPAEYVTLSYDVSTSGVFATTGRARIDEEYELKIDVSSTVDAGLSRREVKDRLQVLAETIMDEFRDDDTATRTNLGHNTFNTAVLTQNLTVFPLENRGFGGTVRLGLQIRARI